MRDFSSYLNAFIALTRQLERFFFLRKLQLTMIDARLQVQKYVRWLESCHRDLVWLGVWLSAVVAKSKQSPAKRGGPSLKGQILHMCHFFRHILGSDGNLNLPWRIDFIKDVDFVSVFDSVLDVPSSVEATFLHLKVLYFIVYKTLNLRNDLRVSI